MRLVGEIIIVSIVACLLFYACSEKKENNPFGPVEGTCTISGKVINPQRSTGLEDVEVILSGNDINESMYTNWDGSYTLHDIPKGLYSITISVDSLNNTLPIISLFAIFLPVIPVCSASQYIRESCRSRRNTDFRIDENDVFTYYDDNEMLFLRFGMAPGTEWECGLEAGVYPRKGTYLGIESVDTPAGVFENCAHFEMKITYSDDMYDSCDLWYASGVGLVKSIKIAVENGEVFNQITDELKSYD